VATVRDKINVAASAASRADKSKDAFDLPPALERRRIVHPKAEDPRRFFKVGLQQGFMTGEMRFRGQFAQQQS
jgi:hypothetical protein